jgi:hypothetical protein
LFGDVLPLQFQLALLELPFPGELTVALLLALPRELFFTLSGKPLLLFFVDDVLASLGRGGVFHRDSRIAHQHRPHETANAVIDRPVAVLLVELREEHALAAASAVVAGVAIALSGVVGAVAGMLRIDAPAFAVVLRLVLFLRHAATDAFRQLADDADLEAVALARADR